MNDLAEWLDANNLAEYTDVFYSQHVGIEDVPQLTESDLREMGLRLGDRKRFLRAAKSLQESRLTPAHRLVTVVFVDQVSSTLRSEALDSESVADLNRQFVQKTKEALEAHSAVVPPQAHSDELVAYFGAYSARERDAERAVVAALAVHRALRNIQCDPPMQARIAVASGSSLVAPLRDDDPTSINAVRVPNLAARVVKLAEPGDTVVTGETRHLAPRFHFTGKGHHTFKGIADEQTVWRVERHGTLASDIRPRADEHLSFIGRAGELAALANYWASSRAGGLASVLVLGEPGIGKSRLIREFASRCRSTIRHRMLLRCSPHYAQSALRPIIEYLENVLRIGPSANHSQRDAKILRRLRHTFGAEDLLVTSLAALLGVPIPRGHELLKMEARQRQQLLFRQLVDLLKVTTSGESTLVIIEDMHWADPTTRAFVRFAKRKLHDQPILVLSSAREHDPDAVSDTEVMTLAALGSGESDALIHSIDGAGRLDAQTIHAIRNGSDGIPLFLEESTSAHLRRRPNTRGSLPARLNELLGARLELLGAARKAAQVASVIGRTFTLDLLRQVYHTDPDDSSAHLSLLSDSSLFVSAGLERTRLSFRHALLRDCAYESLLDSERRSIHGDVADACAADPGYPSELIAQHLIQAGRPHEATPHLQKAARLATQNGAFREALHHIDTALALSDSPTDRQTLLLAKLPPLLGNDSYSSPRLSKVLDEAIELSTETGLLDRIFPFLAGRWIFTQAIGAHEQARAYALEFVDLATQLDSQQAITAAHINAAWSEFNLGAFEHAASHLDSAQITRQSAPHGDVGFAYGTDAMIGREACRVQTSWCLGEFGEAKRASRAALVRRAAVGDAQSVFIATQYGGAMAFTLLREWDLVLKYALEMVEMVDIAGSVSTGRFYSALATIHIRRSIEWLADAAAAEQDISSMGFQYLMPFWKASMAEACALYGDPAQGNEYLEDSFAITAKTDERWFGPEQHRVAALCAEHPTERNAALARSLALSRQQRNVGFGLRAADTVESLPVSEVSADLKSAAKELRGNYARGL